MLHFSVASFKTRNLEVSHQVPFFVGSIPCLFWTSQLDIRHPNFHPNLGNKQAKIMLTIACSQTFLWKRSKKKKGKTFEAFEDHSFCGVPILNNLCHNLFATYKASPGLGFSLLGVVGKLYAQPIPDDIQKLLETSINHQRSTSLPEAKKWVRNSTSPSLLGMVCLYHFGE